MAQLHKLFVELALDDRDFRKGLANSTRGLKGFSAQLQNVATLGATAAASLAAGAIALGEFAEMGSKVATVSTAFTSKVGNQEQALRKLRAATKGLVSDQQLMVQANTALTLGSATSVEGFATLAETAQKLGRALGLDTAFALNSLNTGIARSSRLMLDNVGLMVDATTANQKYAASIGKSVEALTDAEKKEAFRIEALTQAQAKLAELGDAALNAGDAYTQLKVEVANLRDELALLAAESDTVMDIFEGWRRIIRQLRGGGSAGAQGIIESLPDDIAALEQRSRMFLELWERSEFPDDVAAVQAEFEQFGITAGDIPKILDAINGRLDDMAAKARAATEAMPGAGPSLSSRLNALGGVSGTPLARKQTPGLGDLSEARSSFLERQAAMNAADRLEVAIVKTADGLEKRFVPAIEESADSVGSLLEGSFDPSGIMSNAIGGLMTSGFSMVLGAVGDAFFGPEYVSAIEENTRALRRMSGEAEELSDIERALAQQFGSFADMLERQADQDRLAGALDLARRQAAASDASPVGEFALIRDALAGSIGGSLGAQIGGLSQSNAGDFLQSILAQVQAGTLDVSQLGGISLAEFLDVLAELESLGDSAGSAAKALGGLSGVINAPNGFKVSLERFRATQTGMGGIDGTDFLPGGKGGDVNIDEVHIHTPSGDGRVVYEQLKKEIQKRVARGGADDLSRSLTEFA